MSIESGDGRVGLMSQPALTFVNDWLHGLDDDRRQAVLKALSPNTATTGIQLASWIAKFVDVDGEFVEAVSRIPDQQVAQILDLGRAALAAGKTLHFSESHGDEYSVRERVDVHVTLPQGTDCAALRARPADA